MAAANAQMLPAGSRQGAKGLQNSCKALITFPQLFFNPHTLLSSRGCQNNNCEREIKAGGCEGKQSGDDKGYEKRRSENRPFFKAVCPCHFLKRLLLLSHLVQCSIPTAPKEQGNVHANPKHPKGGWPVGLDVLGFPRPKGMNERSWVAHPCTHHKLRHPWAWHKWDAVVTQQLAASPVPGTKRASPSPFSLLLLLALSQMEQNSFQDLQMLCF